MQQRATPGTSGSAHQRTAPELEDHPGTAAAELTASGRVAADTIRLAVTELEHRALHDLPADAIVGLRTALLDKRLLTRFYRPATLADPRAKAGWVEPDLAPFPWADTDRRQAGEAQAR